VKEISSASLLPHDTECPQIITVIVYNFWGQIRVQGQSPPTTHPAAEKFDHRKCSPGGAFLSVWGAEEEI
jgi:hypothetical protein